MAVVALPESLVSKTSRVISLIALGGLLLLAFAIVFDVCCRWLLKAPIAGVRDLTGLLVAVIIAASFPACFAQKSNITIQFLGIFLGPWYRGLLDLFGHIVTFVVLSVMAWEFWLYAHALSVSNEKTWILLWPVSPWYYAVSLLISICCVVQIVVTYEGIRHMIGLNRRQAPETTQHSGRG